MALGMASAGAAGAVADGPGDALWRDYQALLRPRLNGALETLPSEQVIELPPMPDLSADLVVHPAITVRPRPCRSFTYRLMQGGSTFMVEGLRCRRSAGNWDGNMAADRITALDGPAPSPSAPAALPEQERPATPPPPRPDMMVRALQTNLHRLAYFNGALDGLATPALRTAIGSFEQDENVTVEAEPDQRAEELAEAAVARMPPPAACPTQPPFTYTIVCGHVR